MPYSIELHFDSKSDLLIRSIWDRLGKSCGEEYLPQSGFPPHITLALFDDSLRKDGVSTIFQNFHKGFRPFKIKFSGVGVFSNKQEGSLFLVPTISKPLLNYHDILHDDLEIFAASMIGHYTPENWTPHCTLSMGTPLGNVPLCLNEMLKINTIFEVEVSSVHFEEFKF